MLKIYFLKLCGHFLMVIYDSYRNQKLFLAVLKIRVPNRPNNFFDFPIVRSKIICQESGISGWSLDVFSSWYWDCCKTNSREKCGLLQNLPRTHVFRGCLQKHGGGVVVVKAGAHVFHSCNTTVPHCSHCSTNTVHTVPQILFTLFHSCPITLTVATHLMPMVMMADKSKFDKAEIQSFKP